MNKIIAFVGPIHGGKTFNLEKKCSECIINGFPFISSDFSDGIRKTILDIFGASERYLLNPEDNNYSEWKQLSSEMLFPTTNDMLEGLNFSYRDLLKNVGETIKKIAGKDCWAKWTYNDIINKFKSLNMREQENCYIFFGSVRFKEEIEIIYQISLFTNKKVEFIFCNYFNQKNIINNHSSEQLANFLIKEKCKDEENVTQIVNEYAKENNSNW